MSSHMRKSLLLALEPMVIDLSGGQPRDQVKLSRRYMRIHTIRHNRSFVVSPHVVGHGVPELLGYTAHIEEAVQHELAVPQRAADDM